MRLQDKTALITGGTSGIGLETARLFIAQGARVAITGRHDNDFNELQAKLGPDALLLKADVRSQPDMQRVSKKIAEQFGGLDIFFANAGIAYPTLLSETDESRYDEIMDINIKGVFFSMQAMTPILREGASVILNASFIIHVGRPGLSLLSASKAAVRSFARTWSRELLDRRIRVNTISPGTIDTPLHGKTGRTPEQTKVLKETLASNIPVGHLGKPEDIAQAALYLASDESSYVVGSEIVVDGGISQL